MLKAPFLNLVGSKARGGLLGLRALFTPPALHSLKTAGGRA